MFKKCFQARRMSQILDQLSDHMLQDIGIARSDIDRIAKGEKPERFARFDDIQ